MCSRLRISSIVVCLCLHSAASAANYPLRPSTNGRYLQDGAGAPFLIIGDAPHSLVVNLNNSDTVSYLADRASYGFNALWIELLCDSYTGGPGSDGSSNYGHDLAGDNPFTATLSGGYYDLTTPNSAYWAQVDFVVRAAATNGLQCMFTPLDQGGWTATSLANGTNRCYQYGQFLGSRYKNSPNIIWNLGNDFFNWATATNDSVILAIANGIESTDGNHLVTVQLDAPDDSLADSRWDGVLTLNGVYSVYPTYDATYTAYNRANYLPVVFLEGRYEFEFADANLLRRQEYWSLLAGSLGGHMYGNHYTWTFASGWQSNVDTIGAHELEYFRDFIGNRAWYDLVPDESHSLLTGGYGTYATAGNGTDNDYATAARTADGTLAMCFVPTVRTVTIDMTMMAGTTTARWFDPSAGTYLTVSGSPFSNTGVRSFTPTGNNADGDGS